MDFPERNTCFPSTWATADFGKAEYILITLKANSRVRGNNGDPAFS
jgi:hypothetical protein